MPEFDLARFADRRAQMFDETRIASARTRFNTVLFCSHGDKSVGRFPVCVLCIQEPAHITHTHSIPGILDYDATAFECIAHKRPHPTRLSFTSVRGAPVKMSMDFCTACASVTLLFTVRIIQYLTCRGEVKYVGSGIGYMSRIRKLIEVVDACSDRGPDSVKVPKSGTSRALVKYAG